MRDELSMTDLLEVAHSEADMAASAMAKMTIEYNRKMAEAQRRLSGALKAIGELNEKLKG